MRGKKLGPQAGLPSREHREPGAVPAVASSYESGGVITCPGEMEPLASKPSTGQCAKHLFSDTWCAGGEKVLRPGDTYGQFGVAGIGKRHGGASPERSLMLDHPPDTRQPFFLGGPPSGLSLGKSSYPSPCSILLPRPLESFSPALHFKTC